MTTRSGLSLVRQTDDDDGQTDEEELVRYRTRSGATFSKENSGYYTSLAQLRSAHSKLYSGSSLSLVGE